MVEENETASEYVEKIFTYLLELVAFFDMGSDIMFLIEIWKANHPMWFMFSMFTIVAPYYICYVPLLRYQRRNITDEMNTQQKAVLYCAFTPLILLYLFLLDLLYLFNAVILAPILLIVNILSCGRLQDIDIEERTDKVFEAIFQLTHLEIIGFRKLRTMSQFTFESVP